ncbi:MAG: DUF1538 domain-containing protein [Lachnospiraceae bacterium]|nr:DUF1538 domain-containing protein [Lachnospiraceae bacterium]
MTGRSFLYHRNIRGKLKESLLSVMPIIWIVIVLCLFVVPLSPGILLTFLSGGALLIIGMMFFTIGSEMSVSPIGAYVGSYMTKSRKLSLIIFLSFLLGFIVTIAEPDLQVLANLVQAIPGMTLILSVAFGVGIFLVLALLRMLFQIPLTELLIGLYLIIFILSFFVPESFLAVAFDSGGVTTGPMTVPFIMAMGVGVSAIRSDKRATDDSFGLVALCSVGPVLAVLILGMIYHPKEADYEMAQITDVINTIELRRLFLNGIPTYLKEMALSMLPVLLFALVFQLTVLRLHSYQLEKIVIGLVYTYIGLVFFLTGANIGFMPAGRYLGTVLAEKELRFLTIPVSMLMGYFIVRAEPAVYVLNKQVEEMTSGGISEKAMGRALSIGVALSLGLAMLRVLTGIPILYFIIPGYLIALATSFFVPKMYTAIAFDSGGVASGPMTAAFLVPFAQGACAAVGGNIVTDAFGIVAMVAMTPLITIQLMGLISERRKHREALKLASLFHEYDQLGEDAIIEL